MIEDTLQPSSSNSSNDGDVDDDDELPVAISQHSLPISEFIYSSAYVPIDLNLIEFKSNQTLPTQSLLEFKQVEPLRPEDVRWFYSIKKKKKFRPMLGDDSLRLENQWRLYHLEKKVANRVTIRGGMYEADVLKRQCFPIYWSSVDLGAREIGGETIVRGTWFFEVNWHPLSENLAETIEEEHERAVKTVANSGLKHTLQLEKCHIEWFSEHEVVFFKDATRHRAFRSIVQKLGVSKVRSGGHRIHRGYKRSAEMEQKYLPISYIVFVIHGIGAKSNRHKIIHNTADFRSCCNRVKPKTFKERIEFIPVEWRSRVTLDNDLVSTITLSQSQGVRKFVNNTAMDILYYTTPRYRNDIVTGLRNELNRIYTLFSDKNPNFKGKVCVIAHSLGSVILHDIITDWKPTCDYTPGSTGKDSCKQLVFKADMLFCVGSPLGLFLCLRGYQPPVTKPATQDSIIPISACPRIYNVFHPFDPVAYRLEPLIYPHYTAIPPLVIGSYDLSHKSASKLKTHKVVGPISGTSSITSSDDPAQGQITPPDDPLAITSHGNSNDSPEFFDSESEPNPPLLVRSSKLRQVAGGAARFLRSDRWKKKRSPGKFQNLNLVNEEDGFYPRRYSPASVDTGSQPTSSTAFSGPKLARRLDYQLPAGFTERKLGYAAFTSHTSYWFNQDLASFVINQLITEEESST